MIGRFAEQIGAMVGEPVGTVGEAAQQAGIDPGVFERVLAASGLGNERFATEVDLGAFRRAMDINVFGSFLCIRAVFPYMKEQGGGKIINIADVAGELIWSSYLAYSISKAALIAVNRGLAKAYAPHIQVNAIAPGPVLFPDYYTDEQKQAAVEKTLLKRAGSPQDVVNAVVFLLENDYITGEMIHVDGGRHII